ncbi:MAG: amylo-alpha-1,6-glucosidase [Gemmatimonadales bacterium]|jgi:glycogen debranching enzyme
MNDRASPERRSLLFVCPDGEPAEEVAAARSWLGTLPDAEVQAIRLAELSEETLDHGTTVWFHWTEPPALADAARHALDAHVRAGGGLVATLAAALLPVQLGWEKVAPDEATDAPWSEEADDGLAGDFSAAPRIRGLQSFRGHPLFQGLGSGCYTWAPRDGERLIRYGYTGDSWPKQGRVVAVQKAYISVNPGRRLAWEYAVGDGWAVCIGAYIYFAAHDRRYELHRDRLLRNAFDRVASNGHRVRLIGGAWRPPYTGVELDERVRLPPDLGSGADRPLASGDDLRLEREATDAEYTLAGTRALLVGRERGGHEEVWFHPVRAAGRWDLHPGPAMLDDGERSKDRSNIVATRFRIEPGVIERQIDIEGRTVVERTTVAPDEPGLLVELRAEDRGGEPGDLIFWTLESDLRLAWPYPASATGRLRYNKEGGALGLQAETGEWLGVRIEPAPRNFLVENHSDAERSCLRIRAQLELGGTTRILLLGAGREEGPPGAVDLGGWAERRAAARRRQREEGFVLESGDSELVEAVEWAKWRLSTYRVDVPGLGISLVAGYGRSRSGEFGDGRPGYAWYFGRDACWTALACLAAGQDESAREVLEFLGRHQDVTGQVLHECTTSGVVHYDAADSSPLYLLLAARYLAATDDGATLRRQWPHVQSAYEFCLSTDSDGDGLIENTNVGHGWVEFGRLGGHHVSLYLAGVWVAALAELEVAARTLGELDFADDLAYRAAAARSSLELSFFDPLEARYANGRRPDGSLDMAETIMTAVPLALGAVRAERCERWLDRVATEDFTAPWGVRLVPRSDPHYDPEGYHAGAAWPLYSGWVSLAEFRAGRAEAARRHWEATLRLYQTASLGAWPEVTHGDEPRSIGVTPDQAWSTAAALFPLLAIGRGSREPGGQC